MLKFEENLASRVSGALQPMLGVKVTVTAANGLLATLYADDESTVLGNPLETDTNGYFGFKAANGEYTLIFAGAQIATSTRKIQLYDEDDDPPLTLAQASGVAGAERIGGTWFGDEVATLAQFGTGLGSKLIGHGEQSIGDVLDAVAEDLDTLAQAVGEIPEGAGELIAQATFAKDAAQTAQSKAEEARDATLLTASLYADAAAGLAATVSGAYFSVPTNGPIDSIILYKNNSGVAEEVQRYPSAGTVDRLGERIPSLPSTANRVPLAADDAGNVPMWLEDGKLAVAGFAPGAISMMGQAIGVENASPDSSLVPLVVDDAGNVAAWFENGLLGAKGLAPALIGQIVAAIIPPRPVATEGRSLFRWRAKLAAALAGTGVARVLLTGDSWAEQTAIGAGILAALRQKYTVTATGFRESNAAYPDFDGSRFIFLNTSWARYDASNGAAPTSGCGPDGHARTATGTAGTFEVQNFVGTGITIYYTDRDGSFEYEVDGSGVWIPVIGNNTGALSKVSMSGLVQGTHTLKGRTTNNAGTVQINGVRAFSTAPGIEFIKVGNGGLRGAQFPLFTGQIPFHAADMQPDVVMVIIGTNDYRTAESSVASFINGLEALVEAYRSAVSDVGFVFIAPLDTGGAAATPLANYAQAMFEFALANGHEFYSGYDDFGKYAQMNALGVFADSLHLNETGGQMLASRLVAEQLIS